MGNNDYLVARNDMGDWYVKRNGASRSAGIFSTQSKAAARGRRLAKAARSELVIKGEDGKIRSKDSYGNDPKRIRDTEH